MRSGRSVEELRRRRRTPFGWCAQSRPADVCARVHVGREKGGLAGGPQQCDASQVWRAERRRPRRRRSHHRDVGEGVTQHTKVWQVPEGGRGSRPHMHASRAGDEDCKAMRQEPRCKATGAGHQRPRCMATKEGASGPGGLAGNAAYTTGDASIDNALLKMRVCGTRTTCMASDRRSRAWARRLIATHWQTKSS
eukprot:198921-Chlamydomonas_euryale.AAC.3